MSDGPKLYLTLHYIVTCVKSYQVHPSVAQPGSCSEAGVAPCSFPQSGAGVSPNLSAVAVLSRAQVTVKAVRNQSWVLHHY